MVQRNQYGCKLIFITILSILLLNCQKSENHDKVKQVNAQKIVVDSLISYADICSSQNSLFVCDLQNKAIYKIKDNKIIKTYSKVGKGPGEFLNPRWITYSNNRVFLLDKFQKRVMIFNDKLVFQKSFSIDFTPNDFTVYNDDIYINSITYKEHIFHYSINGEQLNSVVLEEVNSRKDMLKNSVKLAYDWQNEILISSFCHQNRILLFDKELNLLKEKEYSVSLPKYKAAYIEENGNWKFDSGTIYCSDIIMVNNSSLILNGGGFTSEKGQMEPLNGMKYFFTKFVNKTDKSIKIVNLENAILGYRIADLNNKFYIISPNSSDLYLISHNKI